MKKVKTILMITILIGSSAIASLAQNAKSEFKLNFPKGEKINVAFLIFDQVEALDLNGPLDILTKANKMDNVYNLYTVGLSKESVFLEGSALKITPTYSMENAPQADILIVPGSGPATIKDLCAKQPELFKWLIKQNQRTELTMSVCTGGLLLSKAGILDGKEATTHYMVLDVLKENSKIRVKNNTRYIQDGKILTTAGITSGLDGTLHLVELINGKKTADMIANILVYNRNGDMSFMKAPEHTKM